VLPTSALTGAGVKELRGAIDAHRAALDAGGTMAERRTDINERRLLLAGAEALRDAFARERRGRMAELLADVDARRISPRGAALRLLEQLRMEAKP
jgi:putative protein kinase ArgK-like GTPase of G3E family